MKWADILYANTILGKLKVTLIIISSSWWKRGEAWEIMRLLNHWIIFVYWGWWISIEATKICYFGLTLSGIGSQPTRLWDIFSRMFLKENPHRKKNIYFKLTKLGKLWGIKLAFASIAATKKHAIWGYTAKYSWPMSLQDFLLLTCLTY